jgi:serine/threonine-protein kinase
LLALGNSLRESIWQELQCQPPVAEGGELTTLGAAHGWAGILYALLRWSGESGSSAPDGLGDRLTQLGAMATPVGRGLCWPYRSDVDAATTAMVTSWCNGAAGYIHLWTLAHRHFGDDAFLEWAQRAAWTTSEDISGAPNHLCCGLSGRAYALLAMHRYTDEPRWLARAQMLADQAVAGSSTPYVRRDSLYHGDVGVALLTSDIHAPRYARMPYFEDEGWPSAPKGGTTRGPDALVRS